MIPKEAVKKARSAGWRADISDTAMDLWLEMDEAKAATVLDPSFWRALGIGLGNKEEMRCDSPRCDSPQCEYAGYKDPRRMYEQFCELIWWDANIKSFWEELLK